MVDIYSCGCGRAAECKYMELLKTHRVPPTIMAYFREYCLPGKSEVCTFELGKPENARSLTQTGETA